MPEWLIEEGIGETRAIRVANGEIVAARIHWAGTLSAGQIAEARLVAKRAGSKRGTVRFANGEEALIDGLAPDASEGGTLHALITRAAIAEAGRHKLAQARATKEPIRPAPSLAERLRERGHTARIVHRFPLPGWDELLADAFSREIAFEGGSLLLAPTPAMTLIDVDGTLPPARLALAAVPAIAACLQRLDIGGSVGIDFPTLSGKEERRAVDRMLEQLLSDWPHERTAMNGFGFVQLVSHLERPSILQLASRHRAGTSARALLRRAEQIEGAGAILLTCHPAVKEQLKDEWLMELARRTGRQIRVKEDPALALEAGFAQAVTL